MAHLPAQVEDFGPASEVWEFAFERFLGFLKASGRAVAEVLSAEVLSWALLVGTLRHCCRLALSAPSLPALHVAAPQHLQNTGVQQRNSPEASISNRWALHDMIWVLQSLLTDSAQPLAAAASAFDVEPRGRRRRPQRDVRPDVRQWMATDHDGRVELER